MLLPQIQEKKVAVIGHFRGLEKIRESCELSILERRPIPGDLPDPACEYILPSQDVVIITGSTLINKTLPRLLQLCPTAKVMLTGPSTPISPVMIKHGVHILAGMVVDDKAGTAQLLKEGGHHEFFNRGTHMMVLHRGELTQEVLPG